jgi:hypothetical protein
MLAQASMEAFTKGMRSLGVKGSLLTKDHLAPSELGGEV